MKAMIIKLFEHFINALTYSVSELKAGNPLPAIVAVAAAILFLDKDVIRVVLILILIVILLKMLFT